MAQNNEIYIEKKQFYLVSFISVLIISSIVIGGFFLLKENISSKTENTIQVSNPDVKEEDTHKTDVYLVREYNGKIGIYKNNSLVYTLDIYTFTLPEKDKKLLMEGMIFTSQEELYELIESYY